MDNNTKMVKTKNKGEYLPLAKDDTTAILNMAIESIKSRGGRPAEYPQTEQGLQTFRDKTIEYLQYVNEVNSQNDFEKGIIPDIESWATFLGITRQTIFNYEQRGGEWLQTIQQFKNAIATIKKQLAMTYKIPPMVFVFDATNNHGYVNSNEFHLIPEQATQSKDMQQRVALEQEIKEAGLVWNEQTGQFEEM